MAARSSPVPTKDALRALRRLALSPYAAVAGTLGSACSLAVVHYHSCRHLRVADKIVETKRTLHTISNGRGLQQLDRMIEAAERGDDFTLHHGRPMKPQRRKASTTIATNQLESSSEQNLQSIEQLTTRIIHREGSSARALPQSSTSRNINHGTKVTVSARPTRTAPLPRHYLDAAAQAMKRRQEQRWQKMLQMKIRLESDQQMSLGTRGLQEVSDLHPLPAEGTSSASLDVTQAPTMSTEESVFFNFVFGKQSHDDAFASNVLQHVYPWSQQPSSQAPYRTLQSHTTGDTIATTVSSMPTVTLNGSSTPAYETPYLSPTEVVPDDSFTHTLSSRYRDRDDNFLQVVHVGEARYRYLFNLIAQKMYDGGKQEALLRLEETLYLFTRHGREHDFTLVKLLIMDFTPHFEAKPTLAMIRKLVRERLQAEEPDLRYVSLLYPGFGESSQQMAKYAPYLPMQYLEEYCHLHPDPDDQRLELLKIIEGTKLCKIQPQEHLLIPLLRHLCTRGDMKRAQVLLDEMKAEHSIETTLYTDGELMRGYASTGNWWKVKQNLNQLHADDISWKRIHGFAGVFVRSLDEYMARHSLEESCMFVMQTIKESCLFPTSTISTRILVSCIREKRHDLLRQYVNMVQGQFPYLNIGTKTASFASALAAAWKEMNATCEDILEGCKAIAVNAVRDPFSGNLRGVISEAMTRNLNSKIRTLEEHSDFKLPTLDQHPSVYVYAEHIRNLVKHHHKIGFTPETRAVAADLVKQTKLMIQLEELVNGSYIADRGVKELPDERENQQSVQITEQPLPRMSPGLRALRLPAVREILNMLHKFYDSRSKRGLPIDHTAIQYICNRLARQSRHSDACSVAASIYNSKWVQPPSGMPYDLDLLLQWLRLAFQIKSARKVKEVLWAAVQSGPELKLTHEFLLAARVALPRTHFGVYKQARDAAFDEAEYLQWRLRWRRREELGKTEDRHPQFSKWEKMGRSPNMPRRA